jgi:hypothetical protein
MAAEVRANPARAFVDNSNDEVVDECPVCLENQADHVAKPCGHRCCDGCWEATLLRNPTRACPVCKIPVFNEFSSSFLMISRSKVIFH